MAALIGTGSGSDVCAGPGHAKGMTPVSVYNRAKSFVAPSSLNSTASSPVFFYQGAQTEHAACTETPLSQAVQSGEGPEHRKDTPL